MRNNFFLLLYFSIFSYSLSVAQSSGKITIKGIIKGIEIKDGSVIIMPIAMGLDYVSNKFDSSQVSIVNNTFSFSGYMPYPHGFDGLYFLSKGKNFTTSSFFLDSGSITMICNFDTSKRAIPEITFSKTNDEYQNRFLPSYNPIHDLLNLYLTKNSNDKKKFNGNLPDSVRFENANLYNQFTTARNMYIRKYIRGNPSSFISLAMIGQSVERLSKDIDEIEETFSFLSAEMRNSISGQKMSNIINQKKFSALSETLKGLEFRNAANKKSLIVTRGSKYTLVEFWFSACKPCIAKFPELTSIYDSFKNRGFEVIGINTDKEFSMWQRSVGKYKIKWKELWDKEKLTAGKLKIHAFPSNFLLNADGKIIDRDIDLKDLSAFLSEKL